LTEASDIFGDPTASLFMVYVVEVECGRGEAVIGKTCKGRQNGFQCFLVNPQNKGFEMGYESLRWATLFQ